MSLVNRIFGYLPRAPGNVVALWVMPLAPLRAWEQRADKAVESIGG